MQCSSGGGCRDEKNEVSVATVVGEGGGGGYDEYCKVGVNIDGEAGASWFNV